MLIYLLVVSQIISPVLLTLKFWTSGRCPLNIFIYKWTVTESSLDQYRTDLRNKNIHTHLTADRMTDPNGSYQTFENLIQKSYQLHFPEEKKSVKFNKYQHKLSNWITTGILRSNEFRDDLYKKLKLCPVNLHYNDVIRRAMASQIPSLEIVYSTIYSGTDARKHQSSASLALVRGIPRWPVNSPHKGPVTRKMFPFDDVIMKMYQWYLKHVLYPNR